MKEFDIEKFVAENETRKNRALQTPEEKLSELKKLKEDVDKDLKEHFGEVDENEKNVKEFLNEIEAKEYNDLKNEQENLKKEIFILTNNIKIIKNNREN